MDGTKTEAYAASRINPLRNPTPRTLPLTPMSKNNMQWPWIVGAVALTAVAGVAGTGVWFQHELGELMHALAFSMAEPVVQVASPEGLMGRGSSIRLRRQPRTLRWARCMCA